MISYNYLLKKNQTTITNMNNSSIKKINISDVRPDLAKEWHPTLNGNLTPENTALKSNKKIWWLCPTCGYKWKAKVSNRANGRGCPCCANKVVVQGINDLATTHPELAKEMNIELTGFGPEDVTPGSGKKAIWKCPKGHTYKATILHRSYGTNCPECFKGRQTSFAEKAVYYYIKQLYPDAVSQYKASWLGRMELDIYIPSINYAIEYDGIAWHKKNRLQNDQLKYQRCHAQNIKLIRLREESLNNFIGLDIADRVYGCENLHEYKNLENVINQILSFLNYKTLGHPIDINIKRDRFKIDSYKTELNEDNLETNYPDIAKEWHPTKNVDLKPSMYKPHSDIKVWWLCPVCGKSYEASIGHRVEGTGCPDCGIKKSALSKSKKVKMIDLNTNEIIKVFDSISDASKEMKISSGNISAVCRGERKQASGYKWEYYE